MKLFNVHLKKKTTTQNMYGFLLEGINLCSVSGLRLSYFPSTFPSLPLCSVWPLICVSNWNTEVWKAYGTDGETYGLMQPYLPLSLTGSTGNKEIKKGIGDIFMWGVITRSCQHVEEAIARPLVLLKEAQAAWGSLRTMCATVCVLQSSRMNEKVLDGSAVVQLRTFTQVPFL